MSLKSNIKRSTISHRTPFFTEEYKMQENQVSGKKYRILTDAVNDIWDRISFWTKASDVEMNDGSTAESKISDIEDELTANGSRLYMDYKNGKYGYNTDPNRGSGTFNPFRQPHTNTYSFKDTDGVTADMGEEHENRYVDASNLYSKAFMKGWNRDTSGLEFTHHVHSTSSTNATVTDNNPTTQGNYGAAESSIRGGCYQQYFSRSYTGTIGVTAESWGDGSWHRQFACSRCNEVCGSWGQSADGNGGLTPINGWGCDNSDIGEEHRCRDSYSGYACTCGHPTGEVIKIRYTG